MKQGNRMRIKEKVTGKSALKVLPLLPLLPLLLFK